MSRRDRALAWARANFAPLILIPLAAGLIWIAIWRVWLPPAAGGAAVTTTVTTVNANATTAPTHKVTTVVRSSSGGSPSRRSEALALALVFLGAGAAVVAVFHDRIGSIDLGKDGIKIDLDAAEQTGAAALVGRLAAAGAPARAYGRGLDRYLRTVASRRGVGSASPVAGAIHGALASDQAVALADRIADELV
ncbi:MAG TPA: hypothetical protein VH063_07950 [Gaiellaceae bacterium]|jgi:hypothetical protein|nr:hypothetical protein [Gaiellaceae bacterium]